MKTKDMNISRNKSKGEQRERQGELEWVSRRNGNPRANTGTRSRGG